MKTKRIVLTTLSGKLSRTEMKNVLGGIYFANSECTGYGANGKRYCLNTACSGANSRNTPGQAAPSCRVVLGGNAHNPHRCDCI